MITEEKEIQTLGMPWEKEYDMRRLLKKAIPPGLQARWAMTTMECLRQAWKRK